MHPKLYFAASGTMTILGACQMTGDPTMDRGATGAVGGAVLGQILGGDRESTLAGAVLGGLAGAATANSAQTSGGTVQTGAQPCQDIFDDRTLHPEAKGDLCEARMYQIE